MQEDNFEELHIKDFSDEGIGRGILDFLATGDSIAVVELVEEASKRELDFPNVEIRNSSIPKFYKLIAAVAGSIERHRSRLQ